MAHADLYDQERVGAHWLGNLLKDAVKRMSDAYAATQERQRLRELDFRALDDIGITPTQAHYEMRKPFWSGRRGGT